MLTDLFMSVKFGMGADHVLHGFVSEVVPVVLDHSRVRRRGGLAA
jgi:hypothetical protein